MPAERTVFEVGAAVAATTLVAYVLFMLVAALRRSRPGLAIGPAVAAGTVARILITFGVTLVAPTFRGPDEGLWLQQSRALAEQPLFSAAPDSPLHLWIFSLELRLDLTETAMRIIQVGISAAGLILLAAAVYDLAGPRAATFASWLLFFEPGGAFFDGLLTKEAFQTFVIGLVVFGGARYWVRQDASALVLICVGCFLATWTRPYAGWALSAAAIVLVLHRGLNPLRHSRRRAVVLATIVAAASVVAIPAAANVIASQENLERLQTLQEVNTSSGEALALEPVNYTTPKDVVLNLPRRTFDVVFRPYPWQLGNVNQSLGLLGTLAALATLWFLLLTALASIGHVMRRSAPFVYPALFLLAAFAVTSGNAGSAFRHRTHLVALGVCAVLVLRAHARGHRGAAAHGPAAIAPPPAARLVERSA